MTGGPPKTSRILKKYDWKTRVWMIKSMYTKHFPAWEITGSVIPRFGVCVKSIFGHKQLKKHKQIIWFSYANFSYRCLDHFVVNTYSWLCLDESQVIPTKKNTKKSTQWRQLSPQPTPLPLPGSIPLLRPPRHLFCAPIAMSHWDIDRGHHPQSWHLNVGWRWRTNHLEGGGHQSSDHPMG